MAVAELLSLGGDPHDDRPRRLAFLESPTDLEERVEEIRTRISFRPGSIDDPFTPGGPGIVDDADEHRALNRLRDHAWRGRHGREEKQERAEGDPPVVHDLWDRLSRLSTIHNKPSSAVFEPRRRSGPAAIRKHNH